MAKCWWHGRVAKTAVVCVDLQALELWYGWEMEEYFTLSTGICGVACPRESISPPKYVVHALNRDVCFMWRS